MKRHEVFQRECSHASVVMMLNFEKRVHALMRGVLMAFFFRVKLFEKRVHALAHVVMVFCFQVKLHEERTFMHLVAIFYIRVNLHEVLHGSEHPGSVVR